MSPGARVMLVAGIANPQRFADDVRAAGWIVVGEQWFADHHPFTARDIANIATRAANCDAEAVFTTDKDAVRLEALDAPFPLFRLPITLEFDPPTVLFDRLATLLAISGADGEGETSGATSPAAQPQPDVQAGLGPNAGGRS